MRTRKSNIFEQVAVKDVPRSTFNLSHDVKMSMDMGDLVPACVFDVLPGDYIEITPAVLLRFAPMLAPVMHNINVHYHFFFIPNRILWEGWEDFITEEDDAQTAPYVSFFNSLQPGDLGDYLGIPTTLLDNTVRVSAFTTGAYFMIYDEYYAQQEIHTPKYTPLVDGHNSGYNAVLRDPPLKVSWAHDYFTSALGSPQRGDAVYLPLLENDTAYVELEGTYGIEPQILQSSDHSTVNAGALSANIGTGDLMSNSILSVFDPNDTLVVDVNAEAVTLNTLRRAFRLQEWLERTNRGGSRYSESIFAHFGERTSDGRLQRPEYIGGVKSYVTISEVISTAFSEDGSSNNIPLGQTGGHGISAMGGNKFSYKVEEHGWIMGLMFVRPETAYYQGVPRMYLREDKFDYAWPSFANIGEQAIWDQEIYADGVFTDYRDDVFGYVPRYAEYKYIPSRVAGDFRDSLDHWHLGRLFATAPSLNGTFLDCTIDERIFAVETSDHHCYAHVVNKIIAQRALPVFGIPEI